MNRDGIVRITFLIVFGFLILLLIAVPLLSLPHRTKAAGRSVTFSIKLQGDRKAFSTMKAQVDIYGGPQRVASDPALVFTETNGTFSGIMPLPADFNFAGFYAVYIKPEKYTGRIFCKTDVAGKACNVPQMIFNANGTALNLGSAVFLGGDIAPGNGKVDAQDISLVMKNLGKMNAPATDINNDGITDVVDYSLVLYSLGQNAVDDPIRLTAPLTATPSPTFSLYPSEAPAPSATPSVTLIPSATTVPPTHTPTPTVTPSPTPTPTPTGTPTPTPLPQLGKNCVNGTAKVAKSINPDWTLDVLRIPYGRSQYQCVPVENIVLHWSDSATFLGNQATWDTLNSRNIVCGLAIDSKETRQMSNFYDDKVTWEGCSPLVNSINIEINGTEFDLWYDNSCTIVNPAHNPALAAGELQKAKQLVASQYGISTSVLNWEDQKYEDMMKAQEKRVLDAVRYLLAYYHITKDKVTGHFKLTASKPDPGPRFLNCIIKKL